MFWLTRLQAWKSYGLTTESQTLGAGWGQGWGGVLEPLPQGSLQPSAEQWKGKLNRTDFHTLGGFSVEAGTAPSQLQGATSAPAKGHLHWPAFSIKPHYDPPGSAETLQGDSDDLFLHLWFLCGKLSPSKCCLSQQTLAPFGLALVCLSLPSTWAPGLWLTG